MWWDAGINPGDSFPDVIDEAIQNASCVLVAWTKTSIDSQWVKSEALEGLERELLVPVFLDDVRVPVAYRHLQGSRLLSWPHDFEEAEFQKLLSAISGKVRQPPSVSIQYPGRRPYSLLITLSILLAVLGMFSAYVWLVNDADPEAELAAYFNEDPISYRKYLLAIDKLSPLAMEPARKASTCWNK